MSQSQSARTQLDNGVVLIITKNADPKLVKLFLDKK